MGPYLSERQMKGAVVCFVEPFGGREGGRGNVTYLPELDSFIGNLDVNEQNN